MTAAYNAAYIAQNRIELSFNSRIRSLAFNMHHIVRRTFTRSAALLLVATLFIPLVASAQVGGAAVVFLKIEPDSRASGMGNAGVALADNASAVFWNPAGLAFQKGTEAGITHS
ncbi:MAG: hypothetical protein HOO17_11965, partial [Bacteroidetes Order II. Incertae sedis bacterium]|nr:hypothetical protein [Bacteroidetes Order II. bacterium]